MCVFRNEIQTMTNVSNSQLMVKLAIFKLQFFKKYFEVFDGIVVIISFVLDVIPTSDSTAAAELVILARLWRVARIINGKKVEYVIR